MDLAALLARKPFSELDEALRSYALEALGSQCDPEEAVEVLAPYLMDAGLVQEEDEVRSLVGCGSAAAAPEGLTLLAAPVSIASLADNAKEEIDEIRSGEAEPQAPSTSSGGRLSAARQAAHAAEEVRLALAPGAVLELAASGDAAAAAVAKLLKSELPHVDSEYLAASFAAFAEERRPELLKDWAALLLEVLEDFGVSVEERELPEVARKLAQQMARRGLLRAKAKRALPGDVVLAVLPEDGQWHEAIVTDEEEDGKLRIVFVEYGKPLAATQSAVRLMDSVVDDEDAGELQEGSCEMCQRTMLLTFHHLIPKDKHPTYLGKRLPRGIEGEPTRHFLNSYGLMICRQCHNTVHRIANNETLALEYNTLAKIMAHPNVKTWVSYISKQRTTRKAH